MRPLSVCRWLYYQAEQRTDHRIPELYIVLLKWMIAEGYGDRRTLELVFRAWKNGWRILSCWKPMQC